MFFLTVVFQIWPNSPCNFIGMISQWKSYSNVMYHFDVFVVFPWLQHHFRLSPPRPHPPTSWLRHRTTPTESPRGIPGITATWRHTGLYLHCASLRHSRTRPLPVAYCAILITSRRSERSRTVFDLEWPWILLTVKRSLKSLASLTYRLVITAAIWLQVYK